ncbi:MAG: glycosyltransferase [Nitrospirota bacterium]
MDKKVCIISFSDLSRDIRVRKHIRAVKEIANVTAVGLGPSKIQGVEDIILDSSRRLSFLKKIISVLELSFGRELVYYWKRYKPIYEILKDKKFDLFIANDTITLPLVLRLADKNNVRIILDAHEYSPLEWENKWYWRFTFQKLYNYICKNYLPKIDYIFTVCPEIANKYSHEFGIRPDVLMNVPDYTEVSFKPTSSNKIRLICHGGVSSGRNSEEMIKMVGFLDKRYEFHFMVMSSQRNYLNNLKRLASKIGHERIFFHNPVPPDEVITKISEFDIGVYILIPNSFNNKFALPNKFFDFIMAGLCVAIGPSPEMARIVNQYNCGIVSSDFSPESLADRLNSLTPVQIDSYKRNSLESAKVLKAESEWQKLINVVTNLLEE